MSSTHNQRSSLAVAMILGSGVGMGALLLYIAGGLLIARWSLADFWANLSLEILGILLLVGAIVIACLAVPIAAYLRFRLVSPLVFLCVILLGWPVYGLRMGILTLQTVFGLAVYAMYFVPFYFVLYTLAGSIEYYLRE